MDNVSLEKLIMNNNELESIAKNLIGTTEQAGNKSIELYKKGLKTIIKPDNSPVTNGDLEVNKILTEKIKNLLQIYLSYLRRDGGF